MTDWNSFVDKLIREAQERGEFDNLPGKGRPLNLADGGFEDPEWRLANRVLKNAGFAPDWIETDLEVRVRLDDARRALRRTRDWRAAKLAALGERNDLAAQSERDLIAGEWRRSQRAFLDSLHAINRQILVLNLKVPHLSLQRKALDAHFELGRLAESEPQP